MARMIHGDHVHIQFYGDPARGYTSANTNDVWDTTTSATWTSDHIELTKFGDSYRTYIPTYYTITSWEPSWEPLPAFWEYEAF